VSFFFARSLLTRETTSCAPSTVSTESERPPNQPMPVHRVGAVVWVTCLIYAWILCHPAPLMRTGWPGQIEKLIYKPASRRESLTV
jgi:hypothetical protein